MAHAASTKPVSMNSMTLQPTLPVLDQYIEEVSGRKPASSTTAVLTENLYRRNATTVREDGFQTTQCLCTLRRIMRLFLLLLCIKFRHSS